jgi:DNA polymerase (family 10)
MKNKAKTEAPNRQTIAAALQETGLLLQLQGAEPFRANAYLKAARAVAGLSQNLETLVQQNRLTEIPGVGRGLAAQIQELHNTGRLPLLDRLRAELPPGAIELSHVLSIKKIQALHQALGITNIAELKAAAEAGKISDVRGFGLKAEQTILAAIEQDQNRDERVLLLPASRIGQQIIEHMRTAANVEQVELAGSVRRFQETVGTLRVVASAAKNLSALVKHFLRLPLIAEIEEQDRSQAVVKLVDGLRVSFTAVSTAEYSVALHQATGSPAYLAKLQGVASEKGFVLSERSLRKRARAIDVQSEAAIFAALGMQYIAPELREDDGEIELALAGKLPQDLITVADIRGMTHCHTTYSDGRNSVEQMARAAEAMGMKYITITDHSPTAFYANGVKLDRLKRQWDEIDQVQEIVKVKLLRGTESDILRDGALDYPDQVLERFDVIIASVHNRYKLDEDQMTKRLLTAMKNPFFKIWGHPLGRLIQQRPAIACRVEEVLDAIAESNAAIEVNGDPKRLDLEPRWLKEARKRGIKFVISTDAHSISDLQNLPFGVGIARRGGVRKKEVLNTLSVTEFRKQVLPGAR